MSYFLASFILSLIFTFFTLKLAKKLNITDKPEGERKLHDREVPLLGGLAIFLSFWVIVGYISFFTDIFQKQIHPRELVGVFMGSCILMVLGFFDDEKNLSPGLRLLISCLAAGIAVMGGVDLQKITNPFGGVINLDIFGVDLFGYGHIFILADLIVFFWLLGMMYTTKILDGLDGLTTGIVFIGSLMIASLSNTVKFHQPETFILALVLAGACLGFLFFNFYPAKIFLGEGGSLLLGFLLGVLAVIAGGKIATALLVMAIPILDLARVIFMRLRHGQPIYKGDRRHLHFQLIDAGLGHRQSVILFYLIAFAFGFTTLFLQSWQKLLILGLLCVGMLVLGFWLAKRNAKT